MWIGAWLESSGHGRPFRNSFLLLVANIALVVRPGVPSSVLAPSSDARSQEPLVYGVVLILR